MSASCSRCAFHCDGWSRHAGWSLVLLIGMTQLVFAQASDELPALSELDVPDVETLLGADDFDWIELKRGGVLVVEPVYPRPETLAKLETAIEDHAREKPGAIAGPEALREWRKERLALDYLEVRLIDQAGDTDPENLLHKKHVNQIIHFEDLMLKRIDERLEQGDLRSAFRLLSSLFKRDRLRVKRSTGDPDEIEQEWPGRTERHTRFLYMESVALIKQGEFQRALANLEELHRIEPKYEGIEARMADAVEALFREAVERENFRKARYFLDRLRQIYPRNSTLRRCTEELTSLSQEAVANARRRSREGDDAAAAKSIERAAEIWPATSSLRSLYQQYTQRHPILKVGVVREANDIAEAYPISSARRRRESDLLITPLFRCRSVNEGIARYDSEVLDDWEPVDLGRKVRLTLNSEYWSATLRGKLFSQVIGEEVMSSIDESAEGFRPRVAALIEGVMVSDPGHCELSLTRIPLRIESVLNEAIEAHGWEQALPGPFVRADGNEGQFRYERQTTAQGKPRIAEIVERRYASYLDVVQAFLRFEVDYVPNIHARDVLRFRQTQQFRIHEYAIPETHFLLFNPDSPFARTRQLRKALQLAIDRKQLMEEAFFDGFPTGYGRLVTSVISSRSLFYNDVLPQPEFDRLTARVFVLFEQKQREQPLPKLRLLMPEDYESREAARQIAEAWGTIGVEVEFVEPVLDDAGVAADWDLCYRTCQMVEPVFELWPLLTMKERGAVRDLELLPEWTRQKFLSLDRVADWETAQRVVRDIQQDLASDVFLIPLWEIDQFAASHGYVREVPEKLVTPYQGVANWNVERSLRIY